MRIKEILNRKKKGIDYIEGDDLKHVLSILVNHSYFMIKQGCGISRIFSNNTTYGNRCFFIERTDGTIVDISYTHALKPKNNIDQIKQACRLAIKHIILEYRDNNFNGVCDVTGANISLKECHIDHYNKSFIELFATWIKDKNIAELVSCIDKDSVSVSFETKFNNQDIINDFIAHHNANTNLRCVSKTFNLTRKK